MTVGRLLYFSLPPGLAVILYVPIMGAALHPEAQGKTIAWSIMVLVPMLASLLGVFGYISALRALSSPGQPPPPTLLQIVSLWMALLGSYIGTCLGVATLLLPFLLPPLASLINCILFLLFRYKPKRKRDLAMRLAWVSTTILMALEFLVTAVWYAEFGIFPRMGF